VVERRRPVLDVCRQVSRPLSLDPFLPSTASCNGSFAKAPSARRHDIGYSVRLNESDASREIDEFGNTSTV
jgi:hypothetical protein